MPTRVTVSATVEGLVDEAVIKKLIAHVGADPGEVHVKNGKSKIRKKLEGYIKAACYRPWVVLVDLDEAECAPRLRDDWSVQPQRRLLFRVAVRAVEAWLLADVAGIAQFLRIGRVALSSNPEKLIDPKAELLKLASQSSRREIREDMVPRPRSGRKTGPAYASRLIEFVYERWQPDRAARRSESLRRAIEGLRRLCAP